jgi:hypothetical protein
MPESEDKPKRAVDPAPPSERHAVSFGAHALQIVGIILIAYVVLHFIIKYW